ncbi:F-box/WD repeat-containing protein 4, partial [Varanus komodoensis]
LLSAGRGKGSGQLVTCLGTDFHRGAGVLDVFYETPSTLLSCGYDTYIRYWDLRTSTRECVKKWEEPHDSALYCIRSNGNHMIASGSSYYGVVRLWDKRQTRCLQIELQAKYPAQGEPRRNRVLEATSLEVTLRTKEDLMQKSSPAF